MFSQEMRSNIFPLFLTKEEEEFSVTFRVDIYFIKITVIRQLLKLNSNYFDALYHIDRELIEEIKFQQVNGIKID
jgi:hypothetical protein